MKNLIRFGASAIVSITFLIPITATADPILLSSSHQGWSTGFDIPELHHKEVSSSELLYRFSGSTDDGIFLSLHVSPLSRRGATKTECRAHYWPITDKILMIDRLSIKVEMLASLDMMSYDAKIEYKNKVYDMPNTHFYFMLNGYCADLHVAASPLYTHFDQTVLKIRYSLIQSSLNSNTLLSKNTSH